MTMHDEPATPELPQRLPTRELLLAQALDACITAERRVPGSAQALIAQQPAWLRADLQSMLSLAGSLDAAAANATMSPEFRLAARARLMQHIGAESGLEPVALLGPRLSALPSRNGNYPATRRRSTWWWRGSAGLLAAVFGVAATLTASASALPGEPLYELKQAQEELSVRLAPDDQTRALALLGRADARLDETARLLLQGRTDAALETTQRYGQSVERATSTYVVTIDYTPEQAPGTLNLETRLTQQQEQLETILLSAPEPARADLREALVTTARGRALVADPRPVERALGRASSDKSAVAAAMPTMAAEDSPTAVPTRRPAVVPQPPAPVVVARATEQPVPETVVAQHEGTGRGGDGGARPQNLAPSGGGRAQQPAKPVNTEDQHSDEVANSPVQAHDDAGSTADRGGNGVGRGGPPNGRGETPAQSDRPVVAQQNNSTNSNSAGSGNEGDSGRGHGDDAPQPVVAHQPAAPVTARDQGGSGDNKPSGGAPANGGPASRTTAPQLAAPGDKPNGGGRDNGDPQVASPADKPSGGARDNGDSHAAPAAPAPKAQATPTATPSRRGNGGGDGSDNTNARPTPAPTRTSSPSDSHGGGGGGGGGGDNGHGGD